MRQHLSKAELADLYSVLRRAAERAEQNNRNRRIPDPEAERHAQQLAEAVAGLAVEFGGG